MMMLNISYMMFIIVVTLLITMTPITSAQFKRANHEWKFRTCDEKNADMCAQRLYIFGYRQIGVNSSARDDREMREYCLETREAEKCVKEWGKKCLGTFEKQTLNVLLTGASQSRKSLCTSKGIQRFLRNRECFVKTVRDQHNCMDQFRHDMQKLQFIERQKFGVKLRTACCFADKWIKCFKRSADRVCTNDGKKMLEWIVDPYVADALDLGCRKEWTFGEETCIKSIKEIPSSALNNNNNTAPAFKSILLPLYHLLAEFAKDTNVKDLDTLELPE